MPVKIAHASISGVFVLALSHFAAGQAYTITDLGTLGGTYSSARAINAGGHVVGTATTSYGTKHAFIWEDGHMEQLDHLPWITENGSLGRDINDAGQVVGCSMWFPNEVPWTATLWERTDETWQVRQIGRPHGSIAMSVNNAGHVAGRDLSDACGTCRAWRWENGNLTYLDCLFEPCVSEAHDINKLGEVAGSSDGPSEQCPGSYPWCSRAVVWNPNGHITDLGPAGGADHWAYGINDAGEVAGAGRPEGGWETAFIWLPAPAYGLPAGMNYLGTLGGGHSRALALNNVGAVVGGAEIWNGTEHAYRWQDGTMMDLNDLLVSGPGWELKVAYDINDAGQIVGDGEINGRRHAFLCTPCLSDDDSDGDGVPDACDACPGGDDNVDTDGDGVADFCDPCPLDDPDDTDGDGVCDSNDICPGSDDHQDSDGDGTPDSCDGCPDDRHKVEPGLCGCGEPDIDDDGDGVANCVDQCPGTSDTIFAPGCTSAIPTVSAWGVGLMALLLLIAGKIYFGRRARHIA